MARTLLAMALAQAVIAAIALIGGLGRPWSGLLELSLLNGFFFALFVTSAWLFRRRGGVETGGTSPVPAPSAKRQRQALRTEC